MTRDPCSWWTQYWWLLKRSLVAQLRNPTDVTSRLLLSCWIGLLAGAHLTYLNSLKIPPALSIVCTCEHLYSSIHAKAIAVWIPDSSWVLS